MYWNGPGSEIPVSKTYENSSSMEGQDEWVLNLLDDKRNGVYVEIGAGHPRIGSNTWMLEKYFSWTGVSIEIDSEMAAMHVTQRSNPCILADAISFDFKNYFINNSFPNQIDYLQVDIDNHPFAANLLGLIALPLSQYKFSVLTIEHGCVTDYKNSGLRNAQRLILDSFGYKLIVQGANEDWWIDPNVIPYEKYGFRFSIRNY